MKKFVFFFCIKKLFYFCFFLYDHKLDTCVSYNKEFFFWFCDAQMRCLTVCGVCHIVLWNILVMDCNNWWMMDNWCMMNNWWMVNNWWVMDNWVGNWNNCLYNWNSMMMDNWGSMYNWCMMSNNWWMMSNHWSWVVDNMAKN